MVFVSGSMSSRYNCQSGTHFTIDKKKGKSRPSVAIKAEIAVHTLKYSVLAIVIRKSEMAPVHKVIFAAEVKEADPVVSSEDVYCVCRQSHSNGFMICCDNCNEWFHGDCIGLPADVGEQHDTFYCSECCSQNPLLKSTFKANPPTKAKVKKDADSIPKTPKKARIINSAGVKQRPRRKSTFLQDPSEVPIPKTPAAKTPMRRRQSARIEVQEAAKILKGLTEDVEEYPEQSTAADKKVNLKPKRSARNKEPRPVDELIEDDPKPAEIAKKLEKTYKSIGIQCDLFREMAQQVPTSSENSGKKRGTCFTAFCSLIARPDSRYCCDECGNFTALTNAFALRLLPNMPAGKVAMAPVGFLVPDISQQLSDSEKDFTHNHKSNKNSQPTEPEVENEAKARRSRAERRKSRCRSPSNSLVKSPDGRQAPAKKPKQEEELSSLRSRSSRKTVAESRDITRPDGRQTPAKKPKQEEELSSLRSRSSRKTVAESRDITRPETESQQKIAKESSTSSKRIYSKTPCGSPKSSRPSRNVSKTVPNSPVPQKKTSKQKHATNSPPRDKREGRTRKQSLDGASPSESKTPQVSSTASLASSSGNKRAVPATSNQRKRKQSFSEAINYDATFENSEKTKTTRCIVSDKLPKEKALVARKNMMMKMSSEKQPQQPSGDLQKGKRKGH
ncbi:microtubule-associated protein futsch [Drosophila santomea]|uniref:microtubule-associated protein futsch n=1 Tax=Drosophila santomea TaxID=129105 RepID=UPI001954E092|nr:microtubule-associated protein futsch [Drosophila santomea]